MEQITLNKKESMVASCLQKGFSLLELLIVIAIMTILVGAGSGFYRGFSKSIELSSTAQIIAADLRHMQSKSMAGEGGLKWGAHFVNGGTSAHYYELFSTPTNYSDGSMVVDTTTFLSNGVTFTDPGTGTSKDVIFSKISGTTTATTVVVGAEGATQTITVSSIGTIY